MATNRLFKRILNKFTDYKYSCTIRKWSVWTNDGIVKSPYENIKKIPNITLYEYIWQNLDKWPERTSSVSFFIKYEANGQKARRVLVQFSSKSLYST